MVRNVAVRGRPIAGPVIAPFVVERDRVVVERVDVESAVMAIYLLKAQPRQGTAASGLQLIGQLPVRIEQPTMTRFEVRAALAAAE